MILSILIVLFSLLSLIIIHELGHFLTAKKLGVKVEEFGIGYPPRIFGKKIGETIYSINLLPFGAFVRIQGEEEAVKDERSFSERPIWQRAVIVLGGVISFWLISFLIFTLIAGIWGVPQSVDDNYKGEAWVQIVQVAKNSPAEKAGLKMGDKVIGIEVKGELKPITKIKEMQDIVNEVKGRRTSILIERGGEEKKLSLVPRVNPPEGEGAMGVSLARVTRLKYPWYEAVYQGTKITIQKTIQIPLVLFYALNRAIKGEKVQGVQLVGPIGIGELMTESLSSGVDNFLLFLALISIWLAIVNILPIPALDGGKLAFLIIEAVRKKPVPAQFEQKITTFFFLALILLMAFVTIKDIIRLL
jgi:regulator of sigma E protease